MGLRPNYPSAVSSSHLRPRPLFLPGPVGIARTEGTQHFDGEARGFRASCEGAPVGGLPCHRQTPQPSAVSAFLSPKPHNQVLCPRSFPRRTDRRTEGTQHFDGEARGFRASCEGAPVGVLPCHRQTPQPSAVSAFLSPPANSSNPIDGFCVDATNITWRLERLCSLAC